MRTIATRSTAWSLILGLAVGVYALGCSATPTRDNAISLVVGEYWLEAGGRQRRAFHNDRLFLCPDMRYVHVDANGPGGGRREEGRWDLKQRKESFDVFLYEFSDFTPEVPIGAYMLIEFSDLTTPVAYLIVNPDLNNLFVRDADSDDARLREGCGAGSATP